MCASATAGSAFRRRITANGRRLQTPEQRLRTALTQLYAYYSGVGDALTIIVRAFPRVPTLAALNAPYLATWEQMRNVLARGWNKRGRRRQLLLAAIGHSLDLAT